MMMIGGGYAGDRWWFGGPITLILARFWRSGGQVAGIWPGDGYPGGMKC